MATSGAIKVSEIGQIAIIVHDLETAKSFYRDKLGIPFLFDAPGMAFFRDPDNNLLALMSEVAVSD